MALCWLKSWDIPQALGMGWYHWRSLFDLGKICQEDTETSWYTPEIYGRLFLYWKPPFLVELNPDFPTWRFPRSHRATPSYHPYFTGIFHMYTIPLWGSPHDFSGWFPPRRPFRWVSALPPPRHSTPWSAARCEWRWATWRRSNCRWWPGSIGGY